MTNTEDLEQSQDQESRSLVLPRLPDDALIILPVRNLVLFPRMVLLVGLVRPKSI